ncbi:RusA family crossover junction endodeoxyribonuclease [Microbacterium sp. Ld4]
MRESSQRVKPWEDLVTQAAAIAADAECLLGPLTPPYRVDVWFYIAKPRTTRATHPVAPTVGDGDKLLRSTFDALKTGGLILDDRFIVAGEWSKEWAVGEKPGAIIRITEVTA